MPTQPAPTEPTEPTKRGVPVRFIHEIVELPGLGGSREMRGRIFDGMLRPMLAEEAATVTANNQRLTILGAVGSIALADVMQMLPEKTRRAWEALARGATSGEVGVIFESLFSSQVAELIAEVGGTSFAPSTAAAQACHILLAKLLPNPLFMSAVFAGLWSREVLNAPHYVLAPGLCKALIDTVMPPMTAAQFGRVVTLQSRAAVLRWGYTPAPAESSSTGRYPNWARETYVGSSELWAALVSGLWPQVPPISVDQLIPDLGMFTDGQANGSTCGSTLFWATRPATGWDDPIGPDATVEQVLNALKYLGSPDVDLLENCQPNARYPFTLVGSRIHYREEQPPAGFRPEPGRWEPDGRWVPPAWVSDAGTRVSRITLRDTPDSTALGYAARALRPLRYVRVERFGPASLNPSLKGSQDIKDRFFVLIEARDVETSERVKIISSATKRADGVHWAPEVLTMLAAATSPALYDALTEILRPLPGVGAKQAKQQTLDELQLLGAEQGRLYVKATLSGDLEARVRALNPLSEKVAGRTFGVFLDPRFQERNDQLFVSDVYALPRGRFA